MKCQFLTFVNLSFSIFALKGTSVNGQQLRQANNNIDNIDPCKGECKNGSTCMKGIAESPSNLRSSSEYGGEDDGVYHCQCPYGWTGVRCDIIYESCSLESSSESSSETTPHYQQKCYNNGECIPGLFDEYGHEQLFCDCSNVVDKDGTMYVGKYCERQAIDYCSDGNNFCVNGAQCNDNYPDFGEPCSCYGDFEGPHCELRKNTVPKSLQSSSQNSIQNSANNFVPKCDLDCANGGYCVMHTSVQIKDVESDGINDIGENYKYCFCPKGYDGPTCEIRKEEEYEDEYEKEYEKENEEEFEKVYEEEYEDEYDENSKDDEEKECIGNNCGKNKADIELCGKGYCYNGGTCVKSSIFSGNDNDDEQEYCDCSTATTDKVSYAGRSCQYEATTYCTNNPNLRRHLFCVNEGMCKDDIYKGCDCPDGFGGFSCEFTKSKSYGSHNTIIASSNPVSANEYSSTIDSASSFDSSQNSIAMVARVDIEPGNEMDFNQIVVETKEETELENSKCGNGYCAHGSKCISSSTSDRDYYCDCDTVTTNDASFAGRFCQYKATSYCTRNMGINHHLFCVNGGSCKEDVYHDSNGSIGCDCKDGFMGFNCEMAAEELNTSTLIPSIIDTERESSFELQLFDDKNNHEDETKQQSTGETLDPSSLSLPSSPHQSQEEEEITTYSEINNNDTKENTLTTLETSGDLSTPSTMSNTSPVDENKESVLVPPVFDDPSYTECDDSKCTNGGICRKGAKIYGTDKLTEIVRDIDHLNATYDPKDFDHCVCRPGFTGLRCEHKIETCDGDSDSAGVNVEGEEHFCLHGSKCIKLTENDNLQQQHGCDCSTTTSNISPAFAGKSCEHKSTSICTVGDILPGKPLSFCVNSGSCLKEVSGNEGHAGCDCPSDWSGPHCEIRDDDSNDKEENNKSVNTTTLSATSLPESHDGVISSSSDLSNLKFRILSRLLIVVGFLVLVLMMIAYVNQRRHRTKCAKEMTSFLTNHNSNSAYFTGNPLSQTPNSIINLAPKQDYNYDGIPLQPPSIANIANIDYQPDPVNMVLDGMGKGKGFGMESSDSTPETNQYSIGRNRRGETSNH